MSLHLYVPDVDATYQQAVGAGAKSLMGPPKDMFWGDRFAHLVDPYGHHWGLATHKEDVPEAEMRKRGQAWMKEMAAKKAKQ
jgi:PhnB protein